MASLGDKAHQRYRETNLNPIANSAQTIITSGDKIRTQKKRQIKMFNKYKSFLAIMYTFVGIYKLVDIVRMVLE